MEKNKSEKIKKFWNIIFIVAGVSFILSIIFEFIFSYFWMISALIIIFGMIYYELKYREYWFGIPSMILFFSAFIIEDKLIPIMALILLNTIFYFAIMRKKLN